MIDFFGPGYDAAECMGLLSYLEEIHYPTARLAFLDGRGQEKVSIGLFAFRKLFQNAISIS